MALWRGFKTHAVQTASRIRAGLGLGPYEPMDVHALAARYSITIATMSQIDCPPAALSHLFNPTRHSVSGLVLPVDGEHLIIYNDSHNTERTRSTITHEVGHVVLNHEPQMSMSDGNNCSTQNRDQEDEATELGGELLIPRAVARQAAIDGDTALELAKRFNVSQEIAQWRMNLSGGLRIRERRRRAN